MTAFTLVELLVVSRMLKNILTILLIATGLGSIHASPIDAYIDQQATNIIPKIAPPDLEAVQWYFTNLLSAIPESKWTDAYTRKIERSVVFQLQVISASYKKPGDLTSLRQLDLAPIKQTISASELSDEQSARLREQINQLFDEVGTVLEKAFKGSSTIELVDEFHRDSFAKFLSAVGLQIPERGYLGFVKSGTSEIVSNYLSRACTDYVVMAMQYAVANTRCEYNSNVDNVFLAGTFLALDDKQFKGVLERVRHDLVLVYSKKPFRFGWFDMTKNIEFCGRQLTTEWKTSPISSNGLAPKGIVFANSRYTEGTSAGSSAGSGR